MSRALKGLALEEYKADTSPTLNSERCSAVKPDTNSMAFLKRMGLLPENVAPFIKRVEAAKKLCVRTGNLLDNKSGEALINASDGRALKVKRVRSWWASDPAELQGADEYL